MPIRVTPAQWLKFKRCPRLPSLPDELLEEIAKPLDQQSLSRLIQTSTQFRDLFLEELYARDAQAGTEAEAEDQDLMEGSDAKQLVSRFSVGREAIRHGCYHGLPNVIRRAVKYGADISRYQTLKPFAATPMTIAVNGAAPWISIEVLLDLGSSSDAPVVSERCSDTNILTYDESARSVPLIVIVERLVTASRAKSPSRNQTSLLLKALRTLLRHGANPNLLASPSTETFAPYECDRKWPPPMNMGPRLDKGTRDDPRPWAFAGHTALAVAARLSDFDSELCVEVMEILLSYGADPNGSEAPVIFKGPIKHYYSPGFYGADTYDAAAKCGYFTLQITPLQASFFCKTPGLVMDFFLAVGANPNQKRTLPNWVPEEGAVVWDNTFSTVIPPAGMDPRVNHPSVDMTPLEALLRYTRAFSGLSCTNLQKNCVEILEKLLEVGADPNGMTDAMYGWLQYSRSGIAVLDPLIDLDLDWGTIFVPYLADIIYTWSSIEWTKELVVPAVKLLLKHGADANRGFKFSHPSLRQKKSSFTPMAALMRGENMPAELERRVLHEILAAEQDAARIDRGWLLCLAITHSKPHLIEPILKHHGNPNAVACKSNGKSVLHMAIEAGDWETARILLDWGANPDVLPKNRLSYGLLIDIFVQKVEQMIWVMTKRVPVAGILRWFMWRDSQQFVTLLEAIRMLYVAGAQIKLLEDIPGIVPSTLCPQCLGDLIPDAPIYQDHIEDSEGEVNDNEANDAEANDAEANDPEANDDEGNDSENTQQQDKITKPPRCVCLAPLNKRLFTVIDEDNSEREHECVYLHGTNHGPYWRGQYFAAIERAGRKWWENWKWDHPGRGGGSGRDMHIPEKVSRVISDIMALSPQ